MSHLHLSQLMLPPQLAGSTSLDIVADHYREGTGTQGDRPEERQEIKGTWHFEFIIFIVSQNWLMT